MCDECGQLLIIRNRAVAIKPWITSGAWTIFFLGVYLRLFLSILGSQRCWKLSPLKDRRLSHHAVKYGPSISWKQLLVQIKFTPSSPHPQYPLPKKWNEVITLKRFNLAVCAKQNVHIDLGVILAGSVCAIMQIATWSLSRTQPNKRFDWYAKLLVRLFCPRSSSPGTPVLPSLQNPPFYPNATGLLVVVESNRIDLNFSVNLTTPFTEQASSRFTVSLRWMDFCSRSTVMKSVRDLKPNLPYYIKKKRFLPCSVCKAERAYWSWRDLGNAVFAFMQIETWTSSRTQPNKRFI